MRNPFQVCYLKKGGKCKSKGKKGKSKGGKGSAACRFFRPYRKGGGKGKKSGKADSSYAREANIAEEVEEEEAEDDALLADKKKRRRPHPKKRASHNQQAQQHMKLKQSMNMDLPTAQSPCHQTWFPETTSGALRMPRKHRARITKAQS